MQGTGILILDPQLIYEKHEKFCLQEKLSFLYTNFIRVLTSTSVPSLSPNFVI